MHQLTNPLLFPDGSIQAAGGHGPFLLGSRFQHHDEGTNSGTVAGQTIRVSHVSAARVTRVRFRYVNKYMSGQTETDTGNTIYVRASVEVGGTVYQLTFSGSTELTLASGAEAWSDWLYLPDTNPLLKGATFYTRTFSRVATASQPVPRGIVPQASASEWIAAGDFTTTTPGSTSAGAYAYGPIAAQGWGRVQPGVVIFGDSIPTGAGDNSYGAGHDYGYATRGFAGLVGAVNLAKGNASISDISLTGWRVAFAHHAEFAFVAIGTNDLNAVVSFATVQARFQSLFAALAAQGCKVIVATIPPKADQTTSGSDWSLSNQVKRNANYDAGGSWELTNTWLKSLPTNVYACIDINEVLAYGIGYWQWHSSRVNDSLHPNTAGHDAVRDLIIDFIKRGGLQNPLAVNVFERKTVMLTADTSVQTTSLVDLGISFPVRAGAVYDIRFMADYTVLNTSTGIRLTLTGPGITSLFHHVRRTNTATTNTYSNGNTAWDTPAASTTTGAVAGNLNEATAHFVASADGTVKVQAAVNTAATNAAIVKRGSHLEYQRLY